MMLQWHEPKFDFCDLTLFLSYRDLGSFRQLSMQKVRSYLLLQIEWKHSYSRKFRYIFNDCDHLILKPTQIFIYI